MVYENFTIGSGGNNSSFTAGDTYTTGDFMNKINTDLGTSVTYSDVTTPDPLRSAFLFFSPD